MQNKWHDKKETTATGLTWVLQLRKVGQDRRMSECVVIIRDGESVKACYRVDAPDTQVTLLKEMIKECNFSLEIGLIQII